MGMTSCRFFKVDHSIFIHIMLGPCKEGPSITKEHLNISIVAFGEKKRGTPSLTKNMSICVMRTCPQSHLQVEHINCVVWSVEQPARGECITKGLQCGIISTSQKISSACFQQRIILSSAN